jgi:hypothetical protein
MAHEPTHMCKVVPIAPEVLTLKLETIIAIAIYATVFKRSGCGGGVVGHDKMVCVNIKCECAKDSAKACEE